MQDVYEIVIVSQTALELSMGILRDGDIFKATHIHSYENNSQLNIICRYIDEC